MKKNRTNPYGSNQYVMDPRQKMCWDLYIDPKSETFGNAYQSALKVGYEESYARTITDTDWFCEKVRRLQMVNKAEKVLDKTLTYPTEKKGKIDKDLLRIQVDVSKHITKTLGKDLGYSEKQEVEHSGNVNLLTEEQISTLKDKIKKE